MRSWCLTAMLGVAACSAPSPDGEIGTAADPVAAYAIAGVHTSPGTVHFTGLPWLLNSAEGVGPMVVSAQVGAFVLPAMTTTMTGVGPEDVSRAVGYSLSARHDVIAVSSATLPHPETSRLEAYAAYEETSWEVRDTASGALLGKGASFNPSGAFFQTVPAYHIPLPDMGLFTLVAGCEDLTCTIPPALGGERDAGTAANAERRAPGFISSMINPLLLAGGRP